MNIVVKPFLEVIRQNCERLGDKDCLVFETASRERVVVGYARLEEMVARSMGLLLSLGVEAGDRVAIQLPKSLEFVFLHLAVMRLGAISLPLNPGYPQRELAYFINDAEAKVFFLDKALAGELEALQAQAPSLSETIVLDVADSSHFEQLTSGFSTQHEAEIPADFDQTCLMIYTSGTTGRPKGAQLTHGNLSHNIAALDHAWGWREDDVLLHVLPIFHAHGLLVALHGALHAGATAILHPKFEAIRALETLERCTIFMAVPTIHRKLVDAEGASATDLSKMRLMTSGSDRLPDDLFQRFQSTFGHTLLERYGMSETSMNLSNPLVGERRVGSVGMPLPFVEARIVHPETEKPLADGEVGAVQIRGPHVCKGYWRQPEKTKEAFTADGWLRTGDMGVRAEDGYFTLKGRSKDLIISGGYNIYPPEVELVLAEHEGVSASAVIGLPSEMWGEEVTAVIVPHPNASITETAIQSFCKERLVSYKTPRKVIFMDALPRNALGKVQKAQLRRDLSTDDRR